MTTVISKQQRKWLLIRVADLELKMATGLDTDYNKVKLRDIADELVALVTDQNVTKMDKLRLLLIYIMTVGGLGDRRQLLARDHARLSLRMQRALDNIAHLGVDIQKKSQPKPSRQRQNEFKRRQDNSQFDLMRYVPQLHSILESFVSEGLSQERFPYRGSPPPLEEQTASAADTSTGGFLGQFTRKKNERKGGSSGWRPEEEKKAADNTPLGPSRICFMLGGLSYSEVRSAYEVAAATDANLIMGTTSTISPVQYIKELCKSSVISDDSDSSSSSSDDSSSDDEKEA